MPQDDTAPALPHVLRLASRATDDVEMRRFLRQRLLVFVRLMAAMFGGLYLVGLIGIAVTSPSMLIAVHTHPGKLVHLAIVLLMLGFWWLLRRSEPGETVLRACDLATVLMTAIAISVALHYTPIGFHLEFAALLIIVFVLVMRSAIIPSTGIWTAIVGAVCSIPVGISMYQLAILSPWPSFITPPLVALAIAVWCIAATGMTSIVSRVIYGLVTQVQKAMHLGQYTLGEKIGEGGMGEVYRGEHAMLRRPTAIKLLLPGRVSPEALARFEREVQLTSRLSHPNTVAIYDYGRTPQGIFYYAMEYLDGLTLDELVAADGAQPDGRVVHVLKQVAGALAEAHGVGLIHRDIKPANVMLCERGGMPDVVKVVDFGLVKKIDGGGEQVALTNANAITGTPLYLAPESITRPDEVDARIDIYAMGALGYFLLTGMPPFNGRTVVEICGHHLHTAPESPSVRLGRTVPAPLEALLLSCLAKDPAARPRDAQAVRALLAECEKAAPWSDAHALSWWVTRRGRVPASA